MSETKDPDDSPESPAEDSVDEFEKTLKAPTPTSTGQSRTRTS